MKVRAEAVAETDASYGATSTTVVGATETSEAKDTTSQPELPDRKAYETVVGTGTTSSVERRDNPPPVLARFQEVKKQVQEEARERNEELEVTRKETKRTTDRAFESFAAGQFVNGIVAGQQQRRQAMRAGEETREDNNTFEHQHFDDRRRYEHQVLQEREATDRVVETEAAERQSSDERWAEQRRLQQRQLEQRVELERARLEAQSDAIAERFGGRRSSGDPDYDDYRETEYKYVEHNRWRDTDRDR